MSNGTTEATGEALPFVHARRNWLSASMALTAQRAPSSLGRLGAENPWLFQPQWVRCEKNAKQQGFWSSLHHLCLFVGRISYGTLQASTRS